MEFGSRQAYITIPSQICYQRNRLTLHKIKNDSQTQKILKYVNVKFY